MLVRDVTPMSVGVLTVASSRLPEEDRKTFENFAARQVESTILKLAIITNMSM